MLTDLQHFSELEFQLREKVISQREICGKCFDGTVNSVIVAT